MPLRSYQSRALKRFEDSPKRAVLIVAPTGAGKGTMACELMARAHRGRRRALFIVHRREIVADIVARLRRRGIPCAETLRSARYVRVMTTQQVLASDQDPQAVDVLIVDEAHHYAADEWQRVITRVRARRVAGFTATPERADGRALGDMFDELIETVSYSELLELGLLVPARVLRPSDRLQSALAQHPAQAYARYGNGERALFYLPRVAEAERVRDELEAHGIAAACVFGTTPREERDAALARLESGELRAVVSVHALTEGIDVPSAAVCVLARPCAHASTYVQIVGRVLRPAANKLEATVIDLVGASHRHGLPGEDMVYSLAGKPMGRKGNDAAEYVEPRALEVLDLELVTVRRGKKGSALVGERTLRGGFVYHDRSGFFSMRWTGLDGKRRRLGLCTKDRATAESTLRTLRTAGESAARAEVMQRKRRRATLVVNNESTIWALSTWNDARTDVIKISLHTRDRLEAEALRQLYTEDREAFDRQLEALRNAHTAQLNARRGRTVAQRHAERREA